ncbi:MAG: archease [Euryarchaeota archaeon]|nr:archease [Euryarchaeota archaeon]
MPFETFEHTADIGLEATGADLETLMRDVAQGFFAIVRGDSPVAEKESRRIDLASKSFERLVVDLLDELIYLTDADGLVFKEMRDLTVETKKTDDGPSYTLACTVVGETFDRKKHAGAMHVKAVTRHELSAEPPRDGREGKVRVILDI